MTRRARALGAGVVLSLVFAGGGASAASSAGAQASQTVLLCRPGIKNN